MNAAAEKQGFHLHLVSDSTGITLEGLSKACLSQFDDIEPVQRFWNLVRSPKQMESVIDGIEAAPGPVLYTLVDPELQSTLRSACHRLRVPCVPVLDPIINTLAGYLGQPSVGRPGLQHKLDHSYFDRIAAIEYSLNHDDGQNLDGLHFADVILTGVSRTSKTPTSMYLAYRGVKAANVPLVPGSGPPDALDEADRPGGPLIVGLTESPERLVALRRARLRADEDDRSEQFRDNSYLAEDSVKEEVLQARRLFSGRGWPVIDVTRRSVEETAAEILALINRRKDR